MSESREAPVSTLHPLLDQLFTKHGFTNITADSLDAFMERPGHALLMFTEEPLRVKETLDLAVIVPELWRAFACRFRVGVILPGSACRLDTRYAIRRWPAFVVLRDGAYVGAVEGLRNWDEYLDTVARLMEAPPTRPPTIGIPVTAGAHSRSP